jgi:vacuolar iron transporter family protein
VCYGPSMLPPEPHRTERIGWLRAAVLGANDGIISTASLMVGVAAASSGPREIVIAGVAGLTAGALSMAAGEYVSVSSQADTERAELERERHELATDPAFELQELTDLYVARGLRPDLAAEVAKAFMEKDALGAHMRDELGLSEALSARPVQAAVASAASFAVGAVLPLAMAILAPRAGSVAIAGASLVSLFFLGGLSAKVGGAPILNAAVRVTFWGALAMALTAGVGSLFGMSA